MAVKLTIGKFSDFKLMICEKIFCDQHNACHIHSQFFAAFWQLWFRCSNKRTDPFNYFFIHCAWQTNVLRPFKMKNTVQGSHLTQIFYVIIGIGHASGTSQAMQQLYLNAMSPERFRDNVFKRLLFSKKGFEFCCKLHWSLFLRSDWQYFILTSDNGLEIQEVITWTNDE